MAFVQTLFAVHLTMRNSPGRSASNSIQYLIGILLIAAGFGEVVHAAPIETSLQRAIEQALDSRSGRALTLPARSDSNLVEAIKTDDVSGWVFGTATQILNEGESADPVTKLFLARNVNGRWITGVEGSSQFAALLDAAPPTLLAAEERKNLAVKRALAPRSAALPQPGLALPWELNAGWYWTGGAHGWSGQSRPYNSLDFSGGNGRVLAARDGYLYKSCERNGSAIVKVVHDNGYATTYYHMVQLTSLNSGTRVRQGEYLGSVGNGLPCGGQTTGPHVHLSLSKDGNDVSVNGMTIGGWQFFEGASAYAGYAVRDQRRVSPQAWLVNYGGADSGNPTTPVSARVQASGQVNLRSGPSLSAPIVGSLDNGRTVQLACYKYGDSVSGNWGATRLWYRLDSNQWISDGFVYTGSNDPVVPECVN
ncbi:M23 family metallopeptidase [Burkholderia stagnalis]|uniref:M23 family metallopeptidase n=1 Tax=Burkholderia stagnalis TaxID=1503054 RepID=UPI001E650956|nr:M23 family metallopeptidase [Burkholderia stagnalis]